MMLILIAEAYSLVISGGWLALMGGLVLFGPRVNEKGEVLPLAERHEVGQELMGIAGLAFIMVVASRMFS